MTTLETYDDGTTLDLYFAESTPSGYGHVKITVELLYDGVFKKFYATTNCMPEYDRVNDIDDYEERKESLYRIIENDISDEIYDWMHEMDNY